MTQPPSSQNSLEKSNPNPAPRELKESYISPSVARIVYPVGRYLVLPFYLGNIDVTGTENIPSESPVIIAPTHRSRWDAFLVPYAAGRYVTGRDLRFMVTIDEMKGVQGWFIQHMGGFPVDQKHPSLTTLRHCVELLCQREMLVIFPEGNIFRESSVQPLKPGLARIALQAASHDSAKDLKILPMSIHYAKPYPTWGTDAQIKIGKPICVADYLNGSTKKNAIRLTQDLEKALSHLYQTEEISETDISTTASIC